MSRILERIARECGVVDLVERLAVRLSGSDLQSLLLEVYRRRAEGRSPAELLADYERNRFTRPGPLDPRAQLELDRIAYSMLPAGFEPVELAPVAPLGANSTVASVDQNLAVATSRNTEVTSDSTNVLALEAAIRRRALLRQDARSTERVRLAASHRLTRAQHYDAPGLQAHFRLFALVTAGRDEGSRRFEVASLPEHVVFFVHLLRDGVGVAPERIRVALTGLDPAHRLVEDEVLPALAARLPDVRVALEPGSEGRSAYYVDACFHVYAADASGRELQLADGGFTTWTRQLLSNAKERLLIGGIGSEAVVRVFGVPQPRSQE